MIDTLKIHLRKKEDEKELSARIEGSVPHCSPRESHRESNVTQPHRARARGTHPGGFQGGGNDGRMEERRENRRSEAWCRGRAAAPPRAGPYPKRSTKELAVARSVKVVPDWEERGARTNANERARSDEQRGARVRNQVRSNLYTHHHLLVSIRNRMKKTRGLLKLVRDCSFVLVRFC